MPNSEPPISNQPFVHLNPNPSAITVFVRMPDPKTNFPHLDPKFKANSAHTCKPNPKFAMTQYTRTSTPRRCPHKTPKHETNSDHNSTPKIKSSLPISAPQLSIGTMSTSALQDLSQPYPCKEAEVQNKPPLPAVYEDPKSKAILLVLVFETQIP